MTRCGRNTLAMNAINKEAANTTDAAPNWQQPKQNAVATWQ